MSDEKIFLDTNVLIYGYDNSAGRKHQKARELLIQLWNSGLGVLSTQVLQEFHVSITRKIPKPLQINLAKQIVSDLLKWEVVLIDGLILLDAMDLQTRHHFSFWDSLIVTAAIRSRAQVLYSEDLQSGFRIGGLVVRNPFATGE